MIILKYVSYCPNTYESDVMRIHNNSWLSLINKAREDEPWDERNPPKIRVLPFITPELHPSLRQLIENLGLTFKLQAGEPLPSVYSSSEQLVLVKKGITARQFVFGYGDNSTELEGGGISIVNRIACGAVNLLTSQPQYGRFFALVPSEVVAIPQELFRQILRRNNELAVRFAMSNELSALSDYMMLSVLYRLSAEIRLKSFFLAWAVNFGSYEVSSKNEEWLRMPFIIQRKYLSSITKISKATLDSILGRWKKEGLLVAVGVEILLRLDTLSDTYNWFLSNLSAAKSDSSTHLTDLFVKRMRK